MQCQSQPKTVGYSGAYPMPRFGMSMPTKKAENRHSYISSHPVGQPMDTPTQIAPPPRMSMYIVANNNHAHKCLERPRGLDMACGPNTSQCGCLPGCHGNTSRGSGRWGNTSCIARISPKYKNMTPRKLQRQQKYKSNNIRLRKRKTNS